MEGKIFKAMCDIQAAISSIGKKEKNKAQGYSFRGIDTVYNELHGLLAENRVFTIPEVLESTSEERQSKSGGTLIYRILRIKYTFYHEDGSSLSAIMEGEAMDSGDKACNKSMSAAHKYLFLQAFSIPTEGEKDADFNSPGIPGITVINEKIKGPNENKELIGTICDQVMTLADNDTSKCAPLLLKYTTFEGKDKKIVGGTNNTQDLYRYSTKRLQILHSNLKRAITDQI